MNVHDQALRWARDLGALLGVYEMSGSKAGQFVITPFLFLTSAQKCA